MIYILSGDIETGKSEALLHWVQGRSDVCGILSPRNEKGERFFLNVRTKETFTMQANLGDDSVISVGRYHFQASAFKRANSVILDALENNKYGYIIIDELGKLEMNSEGLHESTSAVIQETRHNNNLHVIFVIRTTLLDKILRKYDIANSEIITVEVLSTRHLEM